MGPQREGVVVRDKQKDDLDAAVVGDADVFDKPGARAREAMGRRGLAVGAGIVGARPEPRPAHGDAAANGLAAAPEGPW